MALLNGARLCVLRKNGEGVIREVPIRTSSVKFGSEVHCTIRLKSELTEQLHCKIFVKNEKVWIANHSSKNPISVDGRVIARRGLLSDGSMIEVCGTRFRWQFDESLLPARVDKAKKAQPTPTSSKHGKPRRTTMVVKKLQMGEGAKPADVAGTSRKSGPRKSQKTTTYTLPKSNKQLLKNIRKRFTMHSVMVDHNEDDEDEEVDEEEHDQNESAVLSPKVVDSVSETPEVLKTPDVSKTNTPFHTPEKENQSLEAIRKTPRTPKTPALENSAMMIVSYTPRSKVNQQKTPSTTPLTRSGYLTPKNENISMSNTPAKSQSVVKVGNSMYLIDLTSPTSSSFVSSISDGSFSSPAGLIDLTTPPSKKPKTPSSTVAKSAQRGLLRSALKNASKTPLGSLRSRLEKNTPKSGAKNRFDDSTTCESPKPAAENRSGSRPTTPMSASKTKLRSQPATPIVISSSLSVSDASSKPETPISDANGTPLKTPAQCRVGSRTTTPMSASKSMLRSQPRTPIVIASSPSESDASSKPDTLISGAGDTPSQTSVMTTDELFDTLVGRPSVKKTYTRKSESPKKLPSPLVEVEGSSDLPKTDVDLWVDSVVAAVTSPEPLESFMKKPNRTTQVRSSQYSDITPHESFAEAQPLPSAVDSLEGTGKGEITTLVIDNELDNMKDKPSIPNIARKSHTPLASKIVRSLSNRRETIGNFFTNMFGKLTVSPVTRVSITDGEPSEVADDDQDRGSEHGSDGSEEVYHDSESDHPVEPAVINPSPKLRQSLRDTRKFIGNALTSLNTSRLTMDNTVDDVDESLLLSETCDENVNQSEAVEEHYDLTDLSARPDPVDASIHDQSKISTPAKSARKKFSRDFRAEISPMVAGDDSRLVRQIDTPRYISTPAGRKNTQSQRPDMTISPLAVPLQGTPVKTSPRCKVNSPVAAEQEETSTHENEESNGSFATVGSHESDDSEVHVEHEAEESEDHTSPTRVQPRRRTTATPSTPLAEMKTKRAAGRKSFAVMGTNVSPRIQENAKTMPMSESKLPLRIHQLMKDLPKLDDTDPSNASFSSEQPDMSATETLTLEAANGTPMLRKAIFAMCTPTRQSRSSVTKSTPQERIPVGVSRRTIGGALTTFNEEAEAEVSSSIVTEEVSVLADNPVSSELDVAATTSSPLKHTPRTRGRPSKAGTPVLTPVSVAAKTPVSVRRAVLTASVTGTPGIKEQDKTNRSIVGHELMATPSKDLPIGNTTAEQFSPIENASRSSRRLTLAANDSTPARQSLAHAEIETQNGSISTEGLDDSEQQSVEQVTSVAEESMQSVAVKSPLNHTPRTRGRASTAGTPVLKATKTPAAVRRSVLATPVTGTPGIKEQDKTNLSIVGHELEESPSMELPMSKAEVSPNLYTTTEQLSPNKNAPRASRRFILAAKESTPARQSLAHAETETQNESISTESMDYSEQQSVDQVPTEAEDSLQSVTVQSPLNHTPRTRGRASTAGTPVLKATKTPASERRSALATPVTGTPGIKEQDKTNHSIVGYELVASPSIELPISKAEVSPNLNTTTDQLSPNKNAPRASRRFTLAAKESTPTRQSLAHAETETQNESISTESMDYSEQQSVDQVPTEAEDSLQSVTVQSPTQTAKKDNTPPKDEQSFDEVTSARVVSPNESCQDLKVAETAGIVEEDKQGPIAMPTPVKQTPRSERRTSSVQTPSSARKQLNATGSRAEGLDQSVRADANADVEVEISDICDDQPAPSSNGERLQEFTAESTPIKHTPRTRGRPSKSNTPVSTPVSFVSKQAANAKTPELMPKTPQQHLGDIPETTVGQDEATIMATGITTPIKTSEVAQLASTPISVRSVTPARLDTGFKTPRPVRGMRTPLAALKKTPAVPVPQVGTPNQTETRSAIGRRSARRSTSATVNSPFMAKDVQADQISQTSSIADVSSFAVAELFSTPTHKTAPTNTIATPFIVEETPSKNMSQMENLTDSRAPEEMAVPQSSVDVSPDLLKHLCERVITLEHVMENLEDSSQQSLDTTVGNSTDTLEGIKQLLHTPAATSTARKNLRSSTVSVAFNQTVDLDGVEQLLKTSSADKTLQQTSPIGAEIQKDPRSSVVVPESETTCEVSSNLEATDKLMDTEVGITSTTDLEGIEQLLKTPAAHSAIKVPSANRSVPDTSADLEGVQQLLKTPASVRKCMRTSVAATTLNSTTNPSTIDQLSETSATSTSSEMFETSVMDCDSTVHVEEVQNVLATPNAGQVDASIAQLDTSVSTKKRNSRGSTAASDSTTTRKSMRSSTTVDSPNLTGVQELMTTPVAAKKVTSVAKTPGVSNLEGVHQLFKTPVAPSPARKTLRKQQDISLVQPATETVSLSLNESTELEGIQRLLKTPTTTRKSLRCSNVMTESNSTVNSPNLASVQQLMATQDCLNETQRDETLDMEGVQELLKTPHTGSASVMDSTIDTSVDLEGLQKMLKTPVAKALPNDSCYLEGVQRLLATPVLPSQPLQTLAVATSIASPNSSGVKQLMVTQEPASTAPKTPIIDKNLDGVQQMFKTPVAMSTTRKMSRRRQEVSSVSLNESTELDGIQQLLKTPTVTGKPLQASTVMTGQNSTQLACSPNLTGIQQLMSTPEASNAKLLPTTQNSAYKVNSDKTIDMEGVQELLKTQRYCETSAIDDTSVDLEGLQKMLATPVAKVLPNDSCNLEGVQRLLTTPVRQSLRRLAATKSADSPNLTGVKQLMATPEATSTVKKTSTAPNTPSADTHLDGVQLMFKTPVAMSTARKILRKQETSLVQPYVEVASDESTALEGVQQMLSTPTTTRKSLRHSTVMTEFNITQQVSSPTLTGVQQLMATPEVSTVEMLSATQDSPSKAERDETADMEGLQELLKTPQTGEASVVDSTIEQQDASVDLEGLRKMLATPKPKTLPNDSRNLEGVQRLLTTPRQSLRRLAVDSPNLTGIQQLMATPRAASTAKKTSTAPKTPSADTNFDGVQQLFKTPVVLSSSRKHTSLNIIKTSPNESINFEEPQQLPGSPVASTPIARSNRKQVNDSILSSTNHLEGVEELLKTPIANTSAIHKAHTTPSVDVSSTGVDFDPAESKPPTRPSSARKSLRTSAQNSPGMVDSSCNLDGVQQMVQSPAAKEATINSSSAVEDVEQLQKTPVGSSTTHMAVNTPAEQSINLECVQQMFKTPNPPSARKRQIRQSKTTDSKRGLDDSYALDGVKELLRTPEVPATTVHLDETSTNVTVDMEGLQQLLKTPIEKQISTPPKPEKSVSLEDVEQLTSHEDQKDATGTSAVPVVDSDRNSNLFSPPIDEDSFSAIANVAKIIQRLDTSTPALVTDNAPHDSQTNSSSTTAKLDNATPVTNVQQSPEMKAAVSAKVDVKINATANADVATPTNQRLKRKLYTRNDPDDKTPERVKSVEVRPLTSNEYFHIMDPSPAKDDAGEVKQNRQGKKSSEPTDGLTDSESDTSDYEGVEVVEPVRKVLPSRASRRNIKTLSEEALAGASPELKYVKPKAPKIVEQMPSVTPIATLPSINEDSDVISQDLSAGRRKVMFNENIQVKEINSPAILGEIIQKVSRGRGGKHQKAVQVIVEQSSNQHLIKPARRECKEEKQPEEANKTDVDETDSSKRTRRGTKIINYAEEDNESTTKTNEPPKRSRRGANKTGNVEETMTEPEKSKRSRGTKSTSDVEHLKHDEVETSTVGTAVASVNENHANQPEGSVPEVIAEEATDATSMHAPRAATKSKPEPKKPSSRTRAKTKKTDIEENHSGASITSQGDQGKEHVENISEERLDQYQLEDKKDAETKPTESTNEIGEADKTKEAVSKRARRPTKKTEAEPTKSSSRSRSKKTEAVTEIEEIPTSQTDQTVVAESNVKGSAVVQLVETKEAVEIDKTEDEQPVAKRARRPAKQTEPASKKSSARSRSKKADMANDVEIPQDETPSNPEADQADLPANRELSNSAENSSNTKNEPAAQRTKIGTQKTVHDNTVPEKTKVAAQVSSGDVITIIDSESHENTDTENVSGRGRRVTKKTTKTSSTKASKDKAKEELLESNEESNQPSIEMKSTEENETKTTSKPAKRAPAAKGRQRRAAATKTETSEEASSNSLQQTSSEQKTETPLEAVPSAPIVEAAVVEQAAADSTSQDEPQPAPAKRGRNPRKPALKTKADDNKASTDEQSVVSGNEATSMPPPALAITSEPEETVPKTRGGKKPSKTAPTKRGRQKASTEEHHPELHHTIEESLNESHMVKTMLPSSHTSTPLMQIEEENATRPRGGRTRKLNPTVAALIEAEASTPSRRSPRSLRAGSESRTHDSQTNLAEPKTKQSRTRTAPKMKPVDDSQEHHQTEENGASLAAEETIEGKETSKSQAPRKDPTTKRTRGKTVVPSESEEAEEVAPKRSRKVPARYRGATDSNSASKPDDTEETSKENVDPASAPARSRRGAKSSNKKVEEPTTTEATETNDETEDVPTKSSRSRKVAAKRTAASRKKTDVEDTEDDEASVAKEAREDVEQPAEATGSRRRPLRTRK